MDIRVSGAARPEPFLGAGSLLETERDLDLPVEVKVREDPDERTLAAHYDDRHELIISRKAATSAMARELALHELSHMARYEDEHPSHTQSTEEAMFLALAGRSVERRKLTHCYQIANHMKDIYADDITFAVGPSEKYVGFFESQLAAAIADRPGEYLASGREGRLHTPGADPEITAVNAAFALAMVERHELVEPDHRLYTFAGIAGDNAPSVNVSKFKRRFVSLADDPSESEYRKALVDVTRLYASGADGPGQPAAD